MLNAARKSDDFDLLEYLQNKQLVLINERYKSGIILYKHYYAEFAGPGAIIGGNIDVDLVKIQPIGHFSIVFPQTAKERISGYLIRRQWTRLIKQITDQEDPLERAQSILNQFQHWFDEQTLATIPDEALGMLVGVSPQTIRTVRLVN